MDAVASMLYLDYDRKDGQWTPNSRGGKENLEAVAFLQDLNRMAFRANPEVLMIAEESTAWPHGVPPGGRRRTGLQPEMEHGLDERHDPLHEAWTPSSGSDHHRDVTFSFMYAFSENFVLPISHDEVVHMKGSLLGKMPGDAPLQAASVRAFYSYHAHAPRQKADVYGRGAGTDQRMAL